jgi:uncharacterized protein involved in exopolysaccharide biosynthesis
MDTWEWLPFLQKRWLTIIATTLIVVAVTMAVTLSLAPVYEATAVVSIQTISKEDPSAATTADKTGAISAAQLMKSDAVIKLAAKKLKVAPSDLDATLDCRPLADTNLVLVGVESGSPERAADVANAVAEAYIDENGSQLQSSGSKAQVLVGKGLASLRKELAALQRQLAAARRARKTELVSDLQDRITTLQAGYEQTLQGLQNLLANQVLLSTSAQLIGPAQRPSSPVRPRASMNLLLGLAGGLFVGLAVARILENVGQSRGGAGRTAKRDAKSSGQEASDEEAKE